jgi:hypothetical protein
MHLNAWKSLAERFWELVSRASSGLRSGRGSTLAGTAPLNTAVRADEANNRLAVQHRSGVHVLPPKHAEFRRHFQTEVLVIFFWFQGISGMIPARIPKCAPANRLRGIGDAFVLVPEATIDRPADEPAGSHESADLPNHAVGSPSKWR